MGYKVYEFPQFPGTKILGAIFTSITNVDEIKQGVISLNKAYDYCFINAANLATLDHLNAAVAKTLTMYKFPGENKKKLRTNSVNTEILLNLSPNANITDSLSRFGISKGSPNLVVLKLYGVDGNGQGLSDEVFEGDYRQLKKIIEGTVTEEFCSPALKDISDLKLIKKNYKLGSSMVEESIEDLSNLLVGTIELSDF